MARICPIDTMICSHACNLTAAQRHVPMAATAIVQAGGKGTRLGDMAKAIPKPMVPVAGTPILEHQVRLLRRYGFTDVLIVTGHLAGTIEQYFGDGARFGVHIEYFRETTPLGTTGALKEIEDRLADDFLVLYGDVMLSMDLTKLFAYHKNKRSACTLVLHPNDHPEDSDLVEMDATRSVTAVHPKPHDPARWYRNMVNAAVYMMSRGFLKHVKRGVKADFGRDILPRVAGHERIYGYVTAEYIKDVGTPERVAQVTADCASGRIERLNAEHTRRAIFLDRDGVINREVGLLHRAEDFELLPGVANAIRAINQSDFLAIVVTNQPVIARGLCTPGQLEEIHRKMDTLLGREHAKLDALYFCPHHPDRGYPGEDPAYKVECMCRKPKTGMLDLAAADFNIDLHGSFLIGDAARDILCARAAGMIAIGVLTGEGWEKAGVEPDHAFDSLADAVTFALR